MFMGRKVAIPFKWGQVFQQMKSLKNFLSQLSVAIPFKWGQVFQRIYQLHVALVKTSTSQSLLNEVKYSNAPAEHGSLFGHNVAIPFKWGQVFQLLWSTSGTTITANSSQSLLNEVKYSNLFNKEEKVNLIEKVAIPFKWGQVFQLI